MILINKSSGVFLIEFKCIKGVLRPKTWRTADLDQGTKGGGVLVCSSPPVVPPASCHSPLGTLGGGQDGICQGYFVVEQPRSRPVVWLVGKEDVVIHTPKEEGCEGDNEDKLSGRQGVR